MTHLPKLAIVGRPNVGKSALFNRICKQKIAIVDEAEGITRDRLYAESDLFGFHFMAIDTGGINPRSSKFPSMKRSSGKPKLRSKRPMPSFKSSTAW